MAKEVLVPNKEGEKLFGMLYGELSKKLVIVCHGLADTSKNPVLVALCEDLEKEGFASYSFDFSGNGESAGAFTESTYHKERDDLQAVVAYFEQKGVKKFCLIGHSMGGGIVKLVAAHSDNVTALVCLAGVSSSSGFAKRFPELIEQIQKKGMGYLWQEKHGDRFPITMKYIESAQTIPLDQTASAVHCPVLCVQGSGDDPHRAEQTREWLKNLPKDTHSMFVLLPEVDHFFNRFVDDEKKKQEGTTLLLSTTIPWIAHNFT